MANNEKTMQYANFNITYGEKELPMLEHFEDIIYPAFSSGYYRGESDKYPRFYFDDVEIKEIDGEYVLVGNYIKDTQYNVHTILKEGKLVSKPSEVPTAPYSRFIIFLKNHRMILVRNEQNSPNIKSFQATVRTILHDYVRDINKNKDKEDRLPYAAVNIVDIPLKTSIEDALKDVQKINALRFKFFPLNNDISPLPLAENVNREMKNLSSNRAQLRFTSPGSKREIVRLINDSAGLAEAILDVKDKFGSKTQIKHEKFSTSKKITISSDITAENDNYIVVQAKNDEVVSVVSEENRKLYEKALEKIINLIRK